MAAKKKVRGSGDALPKMINSDRVLRALEGTMTERQFIAAYDRAAAPRGGGLKKPSEKLQSAYRKFRKSGDFEAFQKALGVDSQRATVALGRMMRWESQK